MSMLEQPAVVSIVRRIKQHVAKVQISQSITDKQRRLLLELYWELDELEGRLILEDLRSVVDQIAKDASDLTTITTKLDTKVAELKGIAEDVKRLADVIGSLVNIVGAVVAMGA